VIKECGIEVKKPGEVDEGDGMVVLNDPMCVGYKAGPPAEADQRQVLQAYRRCLHLREQDSPKTHAR
jgi:hypothetical protein